MAGPKILDPAQLDRIRRYPEEVGRIAVLCWYCCDARAPTPMAFGGYDLFHEFPRTETECGDAVDVLPFPKYGQV